MTDIKQTVVQARTVGEPDYGGWMLWLVVMACGHSRSVESLSQPAQVECLECNDTHFEEKP